MKKISVLILTLALLLSLTACGGKTENTGNPGNTEQLAENLPQETPAPKESIEEKTEETSEAVSFSPMMNRIQACGCFTYALLPDGTLTVSAQPAGGENVVDSYADYASWSGIVNFSVNDEAVAAVLEDGTVRQCGGLKDQLEYADFSGISEWKDIVQVAMGKYHLLGLKSDGTVLMAGCPLMNNPTDTAGYVQVEAGCYPMGVKKDGTVKVWEWLWSDPIDDVSSWTDIVRVSSTWNHIVGLKSDGTVVACGNNDFGQCNVEGWTDIVAVSAGMEFTLGLKSDGTVVACGNNESGQCDVGGWSNITEIDAGYYHSAGILNDGSAVAAGADWQGQCSVGDWMLFS